MKKFLVGSLLGISLMPSLAFVAHAQVQTQNPCDIDVTTCLKAQILILQELIVLVQQLNELLAQQSQQVSQQGQQIGQIQDTVNNIQQSTNPPSSGSTQVLPPPPAPAVTISVYTSGLWGTDINYHGAEPTMTAYRGPVQSDDFNFFIKPAVYNPSEASKIHISTDNPDGFQRKNWHSGDSSLTTDDTFDYSGSGDNSVIGVMAYQPGVWHYTLSVVGHPEATVVVILTILPKP